MLRFLADTSASGPTVVENGDHGIEDHRTGTCLMSEGNMLSCLFVIGSVKPHCDKVRPLFELYFSMEGVFRFFFNDLLKEFETKYNFILFWV